MKLDFPIRTIFYAIDETIREYRKFSLSNLNRVDPDMTVDQFMVLTLLEAEPQYSQADIANLIFRDNASITRMIESMVRKGYLSRSVDPEDRRRFKLRCTAKGERALEQLAPTIRANRKQALEGVSQEELEQLSRTLKKITANCRQSRLREAEQRK